MEPMNDDIRKKIWTMIKDIRIAHMVTHGDDALFSARPMATMNKTFDGTLWFFTAEGLPKVADISHDPRVLLTYSNPSHQNYVTVQGKARLVDDRKKIEELWSEAARIWFPKGKEDMSLKAIAVDVERAEYWDGPSSSLVLLYDYAVARVTGEVPKVGENRKVAF